MWQSEELGYQQQLQYRGRVTSTAQKANHRLSISLFGFVRCNPPLTKEVNLRYLPFLNRVLTGCSYKIYPVFMSRGEPAYRQVA